jgi:hypothetical protein
VQTALAVDAIIRRMRVARCIVVGLLALGITAQGYASVSFMNPACAMPHGAAPGTAPTSGAPHADAAMPAQHAHHAPGVPLADESPQDHSGSAGDHVSCTCLAGCHPMSAVPVEIRPSPGRVLMLLQASAVPVPSFSSHVDSRHWRPPALI